MGEHGGGLAGEGGHILLQVVLVLLALIVLVVSELDRCSLDGLLPALSGLPLILTVLLLLSLLLLVVVPSQH